MAKEEDDDKLPDKDIAKGFYAKYEPKEILGRLGFFFVKKEPIVFNRLFFSRGVSSTVRRCIEKETGKEYAAKIIDLSNDSVDGTSSYEATKQEIHILRHVAGHPYIST